MTHLTKCAGRIWQLCTLLLVLLLTGCETIAYYSQAVGGQWQIWRQRQPIEQLLVDSNTDEQLKIRLRQVQAIRQFASQRLLLPDNQSYRYYTDLERPYVVWNVVATEALSVKPKEWCFPIAGCVNYRGYFSRQQAINYADKLAKQGYDTYIAGVTAYSTLGWFDDPLLNTFIAYDEPHLAGLIFHELAHQQLYIAGDTSFNESFARAVEITGLSLWLNSPERTALIESNQHFQLSDYLLEQRINGDFVGIMLDGRQQLAGLYQQDQSDAQLLISKQQLIASIKQRFNEQFKAQWPSNHGYDQWVNDTATHRQLNNAKLASVSNYYQWLEAFKQILLAENYNLALFYQQVKILAQLSPEQRELALQRLTSTE